MMMMSGGNKIQNNNNFNNNNNNNIHHNNGTVVMDSGPESDGESGATTINNGGVRHRIHHTNNNHNDHNSSSSSSSADYVTFDPQQRQLFEFNRYFPMFENEIAEAVSGTGAINGANHGRNQSNNNNNNNGNVTSRKQLISGTNQQQPPQPPLQREQQQRYRQRQQRLPQDFVSNIRHLADDDHADDVDNIIIDDHADMDDDMAVIDFSADVTGADQLQYQTSRSTSYDSFIFDYVDPSNNYDPFYEPPPPTQHFVRRQQQQPPRPHRFQVNRLPSSYTVEEGTEELDEEEDEDVANGVQKFSPEIISDDVEAIMEADDDFYLDHTQPPYLIEDSDDADDHEGSKSYGLIQNFKRQQQSLHMLHPQFQQMQMIQMMQMHQQQQSQQQQQHHLYSSAEAAAMYTGNPFSYQLHTIVEESENESLQTLSSLNSLSSLQPPNAGGDSKVGSNHHNHLHHAHPLYHQHDNNHQHHRRRGHKTELGELSDPSATGSPSSSAESSPTIAKKMFSKQSSSRSTTTASSGGVNTAQSSSYGGVGGEDLSQISFTSSSSSASSSASSITSETQLDVDDDDNSVGVNPIISNQQTAANSTTASIMENETLQPVSACVPHRMFASSDEDDDDDDRSVHDSNAKLNLDKDLLLEPDFEPDPISASSKLERYFTTSLLEAKQAASRSASSAITVTATTSKQTIIDDEMSNNSDKSVPNRVQSHRRTSIETTFPATKSLSTKSLSEKSKSIKQCTKNLNQNRKSSHLLRTSLIRLLIDPTLRRTISFEQFARFNALIRLDWIALLRGITQLDNRVFTNTIAAKIVALYLAQWSAIELRQLAVRYLIDYEVPKVSVTHLLRNHRFPVAALRRFRRSPKRVIVAGQQRRNQSSHGDEIVAEHDHDNRSASRRIKITINDRSQASVIIINNNDKEKNIDHNSDDTDSAPKIPIRTRRNRNLPLAHNTSEPISGSNFASANGNINKTIYRTILQINNINNSNDRSRNDNNSATQQQQHRSSNNQNSINSKTIDVGFYGDDHDRDETSGRALSRLLKETNPQNRTFIVKTKLNVKSSDSVNDSSSSSMIDESMSNVGNRLEIRNNDRLSVNRSGLLNSSRQLLLGSLRGTRSNEKDENRNGRYTDSTSASSSSRGEGKFRTISTINRPSTIISGGASVNKPHQKPATKSAGKISSSRLTTACDQVNGSQSIEAAYQAASSKLDRHGCGSKSFRSEPSSTSSSSNPLMNLFSFVRGKSRSSSSSTNAENRHHKDVEHQVSDTTGSKYSIFSSTSGPSRSKSLSEPNLHRSKKRAIAESIEANKTAATTTATSIATITVSESSSDMLDDFRETDKLNQMAGSSGEQKSYSTSYLIDNDFSSIDDIIATTASSTANNQANHSRNGTHSTPSLAFTNHNNHNNHNQNNKYSFTLNPRTRNAHPHHHNNHRSSDSVDAIPSMSHSSLTASLRRTSATNPANTITTASATATNTTNLDVLKYPFPVQPNTKSQPSSMPNADIDGEWQSVRSRSPIESSLNQSNSIYIYSLNESTKANDRIDRTASVAADFVNSYTRFCTPSASSTGGSVGEIAMSLSYDMRLCALEISIHKCRVEVIAKQKIDLYAKLYLLPDRDKLGKKKTNIVKAYKAAAARTPNQLQAEFNETLRFVAPFGEFTDRRLSLSVWHSDKFGRNVAVAETVLGPLDTPVLTCDELSMLHWYRLMEPQSFHSFSPSSGIALGSSPPAKAPNAEPIYETMRRPIGSFTPYDEILSEINVSNTATSSATMTTTTTNRQQNGYASSHSDLETSSTISPSIGGVGDAASIGTIFLAIRYETDPDATPLAQVPPPCTSLISSPSSSRNNNVTSSIVGSLQLLLKEAKNLRFPSTASGSIFCKIALLPERHKADRDKSAAKKIVESCSSNLKWDQKFTFANLSAAELQRRSLQIGVWFQTEYSMQKSGKKFLIGAVRLGADSSESMTEEVSLWNQLLDRPNMWAYGDIPLRKLA